MSAALVIAGQVYRVKYPFVRCEVDVPDAEGFTTVQGWKPGVEFVSRPPYHDDSDTICHGEGEMILTVVDVFKPGKFPARVFFTRRWVRPDGKEFGKGALHITTIPAFKRRATAYMHEYEIRAALSAATGLPQP